MKKTLFLIMFSALLFSGCTAENPDYFSVSRTGQIAEHKLTQQKCLVKKISICDESWSWQCKEKYGNDYSDRMICVFEDGTEKEVYESEYQVRNTSK